MKLANELSFYLIIPSSPLCFSNALYLEKSSSKAKFTQVGKKWRKTLFHCLLFNFLQYFDYTKAGFWVPLFIQPLIPYPTCPMPMYMMLLLPYLNWCFLPKSSWFPMVALLSFICLARPTSILGNDWDQSADNWRGPIWQFQMSTLNIEKGGCGVSDIKSRPYYYCPQFPIAEL